MALKGSQTSIDLTCCRGATVGYEIDCSGDREACMAPNQSQEGGEKTLLCRESTPWPIRCTMWAFLTAWGWGFGAHCMVGEKRGC